MLANDSDRDGDTLSVVAVSEPAFGSATVNADGTITYTPAPDYNGADTFAYTVDDGHGGIDTATVNVTVSSANDAPAATADSSRRTRTRAVIVAVAANDIDVDGDSLSASAVNAPAHGTAVVNADGTVTYTPAANFSGSDSFSYTLTDGQGGSAVGTVSVTVSSVNDAPVAANDAATTGEDTSVSIAVLANDSDADGDSLTVSGVGAVMHGSAEMNADGPSATRRPPGYSGSDGLPTRSVTARAAARRPRSASR